MTLRNRRFLRRIDPVCRKQIYPTSDVTQGFQDQDVQLSLPTPRTPVEPQAIQEGESSSQGRDIGTSETSQQNTPTLGNSTPRIPHAAEPAPRRRILGEEQTVAQGDKGDRAGGENDDRQLRRGARIRKPQVQFSPQLFGKSHTKGRDERVDSKE